MKFVYTFLFLVCTAATLFAQQGNPNTLTVSVDDKPYETEPRRIRIGHVAYVTGNKVGPDQSLRIWLGAVDGREITESGTYLIIGENETGKKDPAMQEFNTGKYKGIAYIKWVEETKSPRMEYHVGESKFTGETLEAIFGDDGYLELSFNATLEGSWWKEKATATVFGGLDRMTDKMKDKAVTSATGYDQDIDPEGRGYKKQPKTDTIVLRDGVIRLKMEK